MSWTDVFPALTDELLEQYRSGATPAEQAGLEEWFGIADIINPRAVAGCHVVAASLFWKNARADEPELPELTRELLQDADELELVTRFKPWEHYVQPLLDGAERLAAKRPEIVYRVYLAADLAFLIPDFTEHGCEVCLMKSSSVRHNPGAMWRFLALEHEGLVTITDADRADEVVHDVERTELAASHGLGHWRVPYIWGRDEYDCSHYRTVMACQFGSACALPAGDLMRAMVWHTRRGTLPTYCRKGPDKQVTAFGSDWPNYGFDEWFLNVAIFPRIAFAGVLTFVPWTEHKLNFWFAMDIEYVTWANPRSEMLFFGPLEWERSAGCCGGGAAEPCCQGGGGCAEWRRVPGFLRLGMSGPLRVRAGQGGPRPGTGGGLSGPPNHFPPDGNHPRPRQVAGPATGRSRAPEPRAAGVP